MAELTNSAGVIVFSGTGVGFGGTPPVLAEYTGNVVTINNNAQADLTWDTLNAGTALLDISTPAAPTVLAAGTYLVQVALTWANPITAGGYALASINSSAVIPPAVADAPQQLDPTSQTNAIYLTAFLVLVQGDTITAGVFNVDGANANGFALASGQVLRLA